MAMKIFEYLLRWAWDIFFLTRLNILFKKIPFLQKYACKEELIRGGVEFKPASFVACASSGRLPEVRLFTCAGILVNVPATDGNTALLMAASHDHEDVVSHLLSLSETDINARNAARDTALIVAAREKSSEVVSCLLAHKRMRENLVNLNGDMTRSKATPKKQRKIAAKLMRQPALDINARNNTGDSALLEAARHGYEEIVRQLLEQSDIDVNNRNQADESALLEAARREYVDIVQLLQAKGATEWDLEKKVARWQLEQMGIFNVPGYLHCVQQENMKLVAKFLVAGMDPNARDDQGDGALIVATRMGKVDVISFLLQHDFMEVNLPNNNAETALILAARENHGQIAARLLDRVDIQVNLRDKWNQSALLEAARRGYEDIVQMLLRKGAYEPELEKKVARWQLEQMGIYTEPDFIRVVRKNDTALLEKFLLAGMSPNTQDEQADTVLIVAAHKGYIDMIKCLLAQEGMEANLPNDAGDTALIVAARENQGQIVTELLAKLGSEQVNTRNKAGESALLEAARRGYADIVQQLQNNGAEETDLKQKVARWRLGTAFNDVEFIHAVQKEQVDLVKQFLIAGMDPNTRDEHTDPVLILASRKGYIDIIKCLLAQEGIQANLPNAAGDTALIVAARENQGQSVMELLAKLNAKEINWHNKMGESALLEAARREHEGVVHQLQIKEAEEPEIEKKIARWQLEKEGIYSEAHFVRAVAGGRIELVQKYLQAGISVNSQDDHRETALIVAIRHRQPEIVKLLLAQGDEIDVNLVNPAGVSAIELAVDRKYTELVKMLQEKGAHMDLEGAAHRQLQNMGVPYRVDVFIAMAGNGQEKMVALFIDAGMHPNAEDERGDKALIEAAKNGQKQIVELLIMRGADVNLRNRFKVSALEAAERNGHSEIVELLREKGAEITDPSKERLLSALEKGDIEGIEFALGQGISPNTFTEIGEPILITTVRQKYPKVIGLLLKRGASVDSKDREGKTALMRAAELGQTDMISMLLDAHAHLEEVDGDGSTPLILAIWNGQAKAVQTLIEAGANVDTRDKSGRTVQMIAKLKGHPEIVKLLKEIGIKEESLEADLLAAAARGDNSEVERLIKAGANPEIPDEAGNTPLALAASRGWTKVMESLNAGESMLEKANHEGDTPLMQASRGGHLGTVESLLQQKININATNFNDETALLQAAMAGKGAVVKLLVERGANPNLAASETTPLIESCFHGQLEAVKALLDMGADANQRQEYGFSPLMTAMLAGHDDIEKELRSRKIEFGDLEGQVFLYTLNGDDEGLKKFLLDAIGLDLNARDQKGWTALMIASREGFDSIAKILLDKGAEADILSRDGQTSALLEAASNGHTGVLMHLIQKTKEDSTAKTSALIEAAAHGHAEAVRLLAKGTDASINGRPKGRIPLIEAAIKGHLQVVQVLLELGADKGKKSRDGLTAVMAAQLHKHDKVVEFLIESGLEEGIKEANLLLAASQGKDAEIERLLSHPAPPKLNARDDEGRTALMIACEGGYLAVVNMILAHMDETGRQAAAGDQDHKGRTPLMFAAQGGNVQIVQRLLPLKDGVIHMESSDKRTALMEACKRGRFEIVKVLLNVLDENSRRVAANHQDKYGNTPLSEALLQEDRLRQGDYEGIVHLLEGCGAKLGRDSAEFLRAVRSCDPARVTALVDQVDFKKLRLRGRTPLMLCAESGCLSVAKFLISKGADVNEVDQQGMTALMLAVMAQHRNILQLLLNSGADCDLLDSKASNALIKAVQREDQDMVSDLVSAKANVNHRDSTGNTALIVAVNKNNHRLVELLLNSGRMLNLDGLDKDRRTALTLAHLRGPYTGISERNSSAFDRLISAAADQKPTEIELLLLAAGARKGWNEAEFIHAAQKNAAKQMQDLIEEGVDVNTRDIEGNTALLIACRNDELKIVQALIQKGAGVEVRNQDGRTPLMEAAKQKKNGMALVEQLFHAKPSLAELNLDLNAQDRQGESALLEAARAGNPDIVQFLIERGANVNVANRRGETPIIEIAKYPYQVSVDALLKCGANACARDTNHRTAIIEAAKHGHMSILENLLVHLEGRLPSKKRMIVINSVDHESRTAVDWAKEGGFDDCVKLLREHGGKSVDETEFVVFTTPDGKCYHRLDCGTISISRERKTLKRRLLRDAVKAHFELCDKCKPSLEEIDWSC